MARKKGSRNTQSSRMPTNIYCWMDILKSAEDIQAFLKRGNERQLYEIRAVLKYAKMNYDEWYEEVDGDKLKKLFKKEK